jgi:DNA segregation ATPase FtsK/SpoIIIE, S-DNA-T family
MAGEVNAKKHEVFGFLLLLIASMLLLCLWTYNPSDSSLNALSHKAVADNTIGPWGAYISDLLFQIFGYSSFLLLLPLLIMSWKLMFGKHFRSPYFSTIGFVLLLASISAGFQVFPFKAGNFDFKPGGLTGVLISGLLLPNFNRTGTLIIIFGAFILGILASTPFSFSQTFTHFTQHSDRPRIGLLQRIRQWYANRRTVRRVVTIKHATAPSDPPTPRPTPIKQSPLTSSSADNRPSTPIIRTTEKEQQSQAPPARQDARATDRNSTRHFILPPVDLLTAGDNAYPTDESELMEQARMLSEKCAEFDVNGSITQIHPGPVVTTFEFKPDAGIKYSKITGLVEDLCLGMKAESLRIDRIPGKATVGIEVPNRLREVIMLRELIESDVFVKSSSRLTLALGKLINGNVYVTDLARMPHLLIAGATGAGKSVALNCMITSILYKATSDEVRFIFIDPKRLELGLYAEIPHLLTPIVTDPGEAANALRWATNEMELRYKKLARRGVRNIDQYNTLIRNSGPQLKLLEDPAEGEFEKPLSYLVIVIDELADLMMVSSKEVEESISRLAAMARAVGIHLILATQRPSVDVITGIIKANFPCRIAFKVASKVDSRTIIDRNGAEQLLGNGDMLFIPPGTARLTRIHGAYVSEKEAQAIVEHLRKQGRPTYDDSILNYGQEETDEAGNPIDGAAQDPLYKDAVRVVVNEGRASTSLLQRRLSIGYGRAAKLIDLMYNNNIVGPADGSKPREVLVGLDFLDRLQEG